MAVPDGTRPRPAPGAVEVRREHVHSFKTGKPLLGDPPSCNGPRNALHLETQSHGRRPVKRLKSSFWAIVAVGSDPCGLATATRNDCRRCQLPLPPVWHLPTANHVQLFIRDLPGPSLTVCCWGWSLGMERRIPDTRRSHAPSQRARLSVQRAAVAQLRLSSASPKKGDDFVLALLERTTSGRLPKV